MMAAARARGTPGSRRSHVTLTLGPAPKSKGKSNSKAPAIAKPKAETITAPTSTSMPKRGEGARASRGRWLGNPVGGKRAMARAAR